MFKKKFFIFIYLFLFKNNQSGGEFLNYIESHGNKKKMNPQHKLKHYVTL
jgi:hypothetical protein